MQTYPKGNTVILELPQLTDDEGSVITTATVEATITLATGGDVPGITNPISMSHVGSGKYEAQIPAITLTPGTYINVEVRSEVSGVVATNHERPYINQRGFAGDY